MGKTTARKSRDGRPRLGPERAAQLRKLAVHTSLGLALAAGCVFGVVKSRRYVERQVTFPSKPPEIVLKNRPVWMTDRLAGAIAENVRPDGVHSAFDHQMLVARVSMLNKNPWIRNVNQVRRVYDGKPGGALEIDCEYRAPIALVKAGVDYWLVDREGVKLPERFAAVDVPKIVVGQDGHTHIRIIEGVRTGPPPEAGRRWAGPDLVAGLQLVQTLYGQPFADDLVKVNVDNFSGRLDGREAQLVLVSKYNTRVRWGRSIDDKDRFIEVPTARKLEYLKWVYAEYGRVDAKQDWIDIRFDKITYPSANAATAAQANIRP